MLQFRASGVGKLMAYPERDSLPVGAITAIYEKVSQIILDWEPKLDLRNKYKMTIKIRRVNMVKNH